MLDKVKKISLSFSSWLPPPVENIEIIVLTNPNYENNIRAISSPNI